MPDYDNEEDVYKDPEELLEDDEIDANEAGFMKGYEDAASEKKDKKKEEKDDEDD